MATHFLEDTMNRLLSHLPAQLEADVEQQRAAWQAGKKISRLWSRDATLWTGEDEGKWLGWLDIVERQQKRLAEFAALSAEIKSAGFQDAVLLGMGGSSLCPEVLEMTFGKQDGYPQMHIVDSTDPAQIKSVEDSLNLKKTIFIVSSKSGSTLEPNIFQEYFYQRMRAVVGTEAGSHFIAVTDPGSKMEQVAKDGGFRHIFHGDPSIGGRYSALSDFGMIPAAVMGLDVALLLERAQKAVDACRGEDVKTNPGVMLGIILGTAATHGRDKITFFTAAEVSDIGAWLEQLIAESTGKLGKGITPVDGEEIGPPNVYGKDRIFAYLKIAGKLDPKHEKAVDALEQAGQPVVRFVLDDIYQVAAQFFTWEIATAVAGSILGINAFNQPDVEASKIETKKLTTDYEQTGELHEGRPFLKDGDITLFASREYAAILSGPGVRLDLDNILAAHLEQLKAGDYFALLAYIERSKRNQKVIQGIRQRVRDKQHVATCVGFGPRFLHSTGQDYKGGPNTGVFMQITADHPNDLQVPGAKYTFGVVIAAQAAGDLAVLQQRRRRALRVHLGKNVEAGLARLAKLIS
jgi:glucose-6-phosphate isomerase